MPFEPEADFMSAFTYDILIAILWLRELHDTLVSVSLLATASKRAPVRANVCIHNPFHFYMFYLDLISDIK